MSCIKTRRHFTEAAREAAARARARKREMREQFPEQHEYAMVVVRAPDRPLGFCWQIRRFGHLAPVAESRDIFASASDAGRSGQTALDALRGAAAEA